MGAFVIAAGELLEFIRTYSDVYSASYAGEFFDGDVIIANVELDFLWVLHHEDVFRTFTLAKIS